MKRYRYITLSLLLLLLSLSTLSAQKTFPQWDQPLNGTYEIKTWPSYCLNEGAISIRLKDKFSRPLLEQLEKVEYDVRDMEGHTYTEGYREAPAPGAALLISGLTGGKEYEIYIRMTPLPETGAKVIESKIQDPIKIEDKYVTLEVIKSNIDSYRLACRPHGKFHLVVRGSTKRPPVLKFVSTPPSFTAANQTLQPSKMDVKGEITHYHFEYSGALPQGTYEYTLESECRETTLKQFTIYGPQPDLPTVPANFKIPFGILAGNGCSSVSKFKIEYDATENPTIYQPLLRPLFKDINKGYKGDDDRTYPEYQDSFQNVFISNYEIAIATQQEYELINQGRLDASTLIWSDQRGSQTSLSFNANRDEEWDEKNIDPLIVYTLPEAKSLEVLRDQKALPGALLIRVKRPNNGCSDYIVIPITTNFDFHQKSLEPINREDLAECSIKQAVRFEGKNFCSLQINYYELPDGAKKPDASAKPVHTSESFGPSISTPLEKQYTFRGYDSKKRYYVELDITDLYGRPVIPKPHLILEPSSETSTLNSGRLFDFSRIYAHLEQPMVDEMKNVGYISPGYHTYLFTFYSRDVANALAGMDITLVKAPEGYEEYQRSREEFYYKKPKSSTGEDAFGGGMMRLGETVSISPEFSRTGGRNQQPDVFYPFRFLYKKGADGKRVVYPYERYDYSILKDNSELVLTPEQEEYMKKHPLPRGIYRLKFEHPCEPGESFYIDLDMSTVSFQPIRTDTIAPVVDYASCDEVRVYPFADGRIDYAVSEGGRPRNMVFRVELPSGGSKKIYFFPYDTEGKPIDHTKFYIPIKKSDLDCKLVFNYEFLEPRWQWVSFHPSRWNRYATGSNEFVTSELAEDRHVTNGYYSLPYSSYNPANDQDDWGKDGFVSWAWYTWPWNFWGSKEDVKVTVNLTAKELRPSYLRYSYVGYRCSQETGYMEFKLINIPNNIGKVILRDIDTGEVVAESKIEDLTDLMVRWDLRGSLSKPLKETYRLEIATSPCEDPTNMQTEFFKVKLLDISKGAEVKLSLSGGACPGKVTLIASNLGIPDSQYTWKITDANGTELKPAPTGRIVTCDVVAPQVGDDGKVHYNTYELTVTGTQCNEPKTTHGIIPVSPDELWWMPDLTGEGHGTVSPGPDEEDKPTDPNPSSSDAKYYDWHNPDNWAFLYKGKFYPAKAVPTRCTNVHIMNMVQFELGPVDSKLRAQPDLAKEVTPRDLYGEPTCIDITFHSGAFVFNIQQLNYRRAMVRYNFGVADGTEYKSDRRIYTTEDCNTDEWLYGRDKLNLLSAPLYDIYAGDYSFSASPYTYQLGFKTERAGKSIAAEFDASAFNDPSPLQSISMAGNNNSIALIVAGDEQGFKSREGKSAIVERHGILELPYFDRPEIANSFYHQTYDASTGQTRFQYFDGKAKRFRGYYSYAQRSKMAYRFIFEDPATQRIAKLADGTEGYTMAVSATAAGQEVMVGNPFMAPLRVVPFLEANEAVIEPYVRLLYPVDVKGYEPLKLDGSVNTYPQITAGDKKINPLGAFVVKLKSGVGPEAQLVFPTTALDSYAKQHPQSSSSLRNTSGDATAETARYLSLTLQSRLGKDRALVAYGYESGSVDKMLLSTESRYPSIAIVDPADGLHKDLYADDAATGHYELATQVSEPIDVTLSLAGSVMGHVVTARLIDHKSGLEHDLTGGKSCQIKLFPDDAEGRLELRVDGDFTSVAPIAEPTDELQAQYSEGMLTVRTTQDMSSLRLVQGDGITVYTQSLPGLTEYSERILLSSGSYIVEVIGTDGVARRATLVVR